MYFKTMQEINYFFEQQNKDLIFFSIFFPLQMSGDEVNDLQGCNRELCSGPKDSACSRLVKKIVILEKRFIRNESVREITSSRVRFQSLHDCIVF